MNDPHTATTGLPTTPIPPARNRETGGPELVSLDTYQAPERLGETPGPGPDRPELRYAGWRRHKLARTDLAIAAILLLVTLLARWPLIVRGETLLHSDEAIVGIMAQDIAEGRSLPIYFYGQRYMGALEAYVVAAVSGFFDDPIHALRFGPACFLAALVVIQYLMLTRWFGRGGGLVGAIVLIAGAPMFTQWSISARGGYIEILLWGSMLLWAYSEWFVEPRPARRRRWHQSAFGALLGSGWWINPSIIMFALPILAHALLNRPLAALMDSPTCGGALRRITRLTGLTTLPVVAVVALLLLNATWATWVDQGKVQHMLLLGLFPKPIAMGILAVAAIALLLASIRAGAMEYARNALRDNGMFILGALAGAIPIALYVMQTFLGQRAMDPSLPLGFRPLWLAGETMIYLFHGLPLLFGADPRPFLQLVSVGRDTAVLPLSLTSSGLAVAADWIVVGSLSTSLLILLVAYRRDFARLLRLDAWNHAPVVLLVLGFVGMLCLYVTGGCTLDFTTIRYLVPIWVFVPGLCAAVVVSRRFGPAARAGPLCACAAWALGQWVMCQQLGNPHPLRRLATRITDLGIDPAIAEPLDAHLLSYLTRQTCRTAEFESFWPRLAHFRPAIEADAPIDYIVQTHEVDRTQDWINGGWVGDPPPETQRFLWPRLRRALITDPGGVLAREPLVDGYERIRLRRPLSERTTLNPVNSPPAPVSGALVGLPGSSRH